MLEFINTYIFGFATPAALIAAGVFFAFRLKFFHVTRPALVWQTLTARNAGGGMSPARALSLALAGTLGVGNIVGVASAIHLGGVGSIFWMWVSALAAMLLKYAETVLALRHRRRGVDGEYHGGAMYYIKDFFAAHRHAKVGIFLAAMFALLCILDAISMGCVIQVNAVSRALLGVCNVGTAFTGGVLAVLTVAVIASGRDGIAHLTERLVPLMTVVYIIMSVAVMILRRDSLPAAFAAILEDAFSFDSALGGVVGFVLSRGVRYGTMRGLMSNEAGCGTAPIAHAGSSVSYPAQQGIWGIFEVFVDTILLCTMTAVVIIISLGEVSVYGADPIMMTLRAYSAVLGSWSEYVMCAMVLFFGFATVICWAHYGMECVSYLTERRGWRWTFVVAYGLAAAVGAVAAPDAVWSVADFALGAMTIINLAVICAMSGEVVSETREYISMMSTRRKSRSLRRGVDKT
ncbi:MAG: sodium:alanine symporter family protein [Clostridia bacterium]|nr:sodium:alanine symporter family protein [Clostridia bacterium]